MFKLHPRVCDCFVVSSIQSRVYICVLLRKCINANSYIYLTVLNCSLSHIGSRLLRPTHPPFFRWCLVGWCGCFLRVPFLTFIAILLSRVFRIPMASIGGGRKVYGTFLGCRGLRVPAKGPSVLSRTVRLRYFSETSQALSQSRR